MSTPRFTILTQKELTIDLSRPAMECILQCIDWRHDLPIAIIDNSVSCELDNFRNTLQNLLERSEPETGNLDLIGA